MATARRTRAHSLPFDGVRALSLTRQGVATNLVEECRITLDQRHLDAEALARVPEEAHLETAFRSFDKLADKTMRWIEAR